MFKIDWPCAIGGAIVGYYTKGKVESVKTTFRKISTDALNGIKESFDQPFTNGQNGQQAGQQNGNNNG